MLQMLSTCKLVINCTPVGMFPNSDNLIDIPYEFLTKKHLIIDLIYNPSETLFLKKISRKWSDCIKWR